MANIEQILKDCNALLEGHFKLTSGRHSDKYVEKIKIINKPDKVSMLCQELAELFADTEVDVIVGPAMGGIVLAYEVAKNLKKDFIFTQRKDGEMTIRSGFNLQAGQKAIIIEDIVTTGGSVFEVKKALETRGVIVTGIGVIVDRSGGQVDFGVPTKALLTLNIKSWEEAKMPAWLREIPITTPGSSDKK